MDFNERMELILAAFDNIDLDDKYLRRLAVKPLHDFFQILLLEVGVNHCHLLRDTLHNYPVSARWRDVQHCLELIGEDTDVWTQTINTLHKMRRKNEHNDYHYPKKRALLFVRESAEKFMDWILSAGTEYLRQSKGFSFIQKFESHARAYIRRTDYILHQYGEKTPYSVSEDILAIDDDPYPRLKPIRDTLELRMAAIRSIQDLTAEDLDCLIDIVKEIERLDAREDAYVKYRVCPKCGSKIVETQTAIGGSPDDPVPSAIRCRVGCEKCDFELFSETVEI